MADDRMLVEELLSRMEGSTLDFKRDQYRLGSNQQKSSFVMDIVCMANTPRSESAYILIGVTERNAQPVEVVGTVEHHDPAVLQNLVASNTEPTVHFSYRMIEYLGLQLGLIEIPVSQPVPVMATKEFGKLRPGVVYLRRGAQNSQAGPHELRRIVEWHSDKDGQELAESPPESSWESFYRACDGFEQGRMFIAVLDGGQTLAPEECHAFSRIGLQLVVDFDQATDECGMYSMVESYLSERRSLRLVTLDEPIATPSPTTCIWVAARGLSSRRSTVRAKTWREWNQLKVQPLAKVMADLAKSTEPNPVTVLALGGESEYLDTVCQLLDQCFRDRLKFVFAANSNQMFADATTRFEGKQVFISLPEICAGLRSHLPQSGTIEAINLPRHDNRTVEVPPDRARWVEEEIEIVHLNAGINSPEPESELEQFLKGQLVSWLGLNLGVDVQRSITSRLEKRVSDELASRTTRRLNLLHWPGGGGSTVARRVLWNLHKQYPTFLAKRVLPELLVDRLRYLFDITQSPALVLVEESVSNSDDLDRVYDRLRSENIPALLFRVARGESASTQPGSYYLDGMLDDVEAAAFAGKLTAAVPSRSATLESLKSEQDRQRRTPFYFGLVAFGKDFVGLEPYVSHRIKEATDDALDVCRLSSLLYHFGHQSTPIQLLSSIISTPRAGTISLSSLMSSLLQELFVQSSDRSIRPAHELIANEILEQILSQGIGDKRNWRSGLAQCAVDTIEIAAEHNDSPGGAIAELMRSVIIERGIQETPAGLPEGQFSNLIDAIPSSDGQHRVLKRLTELFPVEAHFWAHLGRFHSIVSRDHKKAHQSHEESLRIAPSDPVLHHMAGMALRGELYELLEQLAQDRSGVAQEERAKLLAQEALARFRDSRELDPRTEHSYISAVDLITRVVGVMSTQKGYGHALDQFLVASREGWYRELMDSAEDLMSELLLFRAGEAPSGYFQIARARLDQTYGNVSLAIQGWTNLLAQPGVFKPPLRRNIINAYLNRSGRNWSQLTRKEVARISELAQANLEEEPDSDQNLRMWFSAVRHTGELPIEVIAERLTYKRYQNPTVDTLYYLYIIRYLQADAGVGQAISEAEQLIEECSRRAASLPHRTRSFEWLGSGKRIKSIVHRSELGSWDSSFEFWSNTEELRTVTGSISRIQGRASGEIELSNGLKAFFVPAKGSIPGGYLRDRDIGRRVQFYLGFSYDGLRAWSVQNYP